MVDNPIPSEIPPTPRTPETPQYGEDLPGLGAGEELPGQKPFSLPEEGAQNVESTRPSPMDVAKQQEQEQAQLPREELTGRVDQLRNQLSDVRGQLQNPEITNNFTGDHYTAFGRVMGRMDADMQTIAENSDGAYKSPEKAEGKSPLEFVTEWIDGSQSTLSGAINYLGEMEKPDIASYMKLQYSVQRATQRGELFASIIGSTVSGIKTILSTQLG